MAGHFERYWEMREGGPYADQKGQDPSNKIFKCKDCGAETHPRKGWNGEPDPHLCSKNCPSRASDWKPGRVSNAFRKGMESMLFHAEKTGVYALRKLPDPFKENFDSIFPDAPGADI